MQFDRSRFISQFKQEVEEHLKKLNKGILSIEAGEYDEDLMKDLMRVGHSMKGSARMMGFAHITEVAHKVEDIFGEIREGRLKGEGDSIDVLFEALDCIENLLASVVAGEQEPDCLDLISRLDATAKGQAVPAPSAPKAPEEPKPAPPPPKLEPPAAPAPAQPSKPKSSVAGKFDRSRFISQFKQEVEDHLKNLNKGILAIENDECDEDLMKNLMRVAHSLKGSARMMGFAQITEVAHKIEDVFGEIREGRLKGKGQVIDVLFEGLDCVGALLKSAVDGVAEPDCSSLMTRLQAVAKGEAAPVEAKPAAKPAAAVEEQKPAAPAPAPPPEPAKPATVPTATPAPAPPPKPQTGKQTEKSKKITIEETIRINISKLDKLVKLVEEMILNQRKSEEQVRILRLTMLNAKSLMSSWIQFKSVMPESVTTNKAFIEVGNQIKYIVEDMNKTFKEGKNLTTHNALVMQELQQGVMEMRMLPLSTIFDAYPRAVRDLAKTFGKKINFQIRGATTPLDKTILEEISDPLVHLIRNAVDHGLETPEERKAMGKNETGTIILSAKQEGDHVSISIQDDGKGVNVERVREKAIERGLVDPAEANSLLDKEVMYFILEPGFSTAKTVTDISGRGVGMDVVKQAVEAVKGHIFIDSVRGKGTKFVLNLPLALAISRALLIRTAGEIFAIPTSSVRETLRVPTKDIQQFMDKDVIRLRGQTIPTVKLSKLLLLRGEDKFVNLSAVPVVILEAREQPLGVMVDEILEEQEIVLKSLGEHLKNIRTITGATILGGGDVLMVLHVPDLLDIAREMRSGKVTEDAVETRNRISISGRKKSGILVVEDSLNVREVEKAILDAAGYEVELAANGAEGFRMAVENNYNCVITDVIMPEMDGFELAAKLRQLDAYSNTPIVVLTSKEREEDKRRGIEVGADAYLIKSSFDQNNLLDTIKRLLD